MKRLSLCIILTGLLAAGCTHPMQFSEISPKISQYHPKSVVILPFTNTIGFDLANDSANMKLFQGLSKAGAFDRIADAGQVKAFMFQHPGAIDVITKFHNTWVATGMFDPRYSAWIGKAFNADTIIFGEVTAWNETETPRNHIYNAGLAMRWVEAASGDVLWKAAESEQILAANPCIFDCSSPDHVMDNVVAMVMENWPGQKAK